MPIFEHMIDRITDFYTKKPLLLVGVLTWLAAAPPIIALFVTLDGKSQWTAIKIGLAVSGMLAFVVMGVLNMMRQSIRFWDLAADIAERAERTANRDELREILDTDIKKLRGIGMGDIHTSEIVKLKATIETKMRYMK